MNGGINHLYVYICLIGVVPIERDFILHASLPPRLYWHDNFDKKKKTKQNELNKTERKEIIHIWHELYSCTMYWKKPPKRRINIQILTTVSKKKKKNWNGMVKWYTK